MKRILLPAALPLLLLGACNSKPSEPEVINTNPDPMAAALANRPKVELPPAIKGDKTFRCRDNSLVYVTFFQGDTQANVRSEQNGPATMVKAPAAGEPMVAEGGWKLVGDDKEITLESPGKSSRSCHL